ncbi:MAG TPA: hypothetical protein VNQ99_13265 [Xanthobacteraceae bacterium]|nr:hypothetical protein [Xanthobacteraceae bacterium]
MLDKQTLLAMAEQYEKFAEICFSDEGRTTFLSSAAELKRVAETANDNAETLVR